MSKAVTVTGKTIDTTNIATLVISNDAIDTVVFAIPGTYDGVDLTGGTVYLRYETPSGNTYDLELTSTVADSTISATWNVQGGSVVQSGYLNIQIRIIDGTTIYQTYKAQIYIFSALTTGYEDYDPQLLDVYLAQLTALDTASTASAAAALASETAAAASETAAGLSEAAAALSETAAETAQAAAELAQTGAETAETNAETAQAAAEAAAAGVSAAVADIALNTTHRTSNGSDHTYIDQAVTAASSPTFIKPAVDAIAFNTTPAAIPTAAGSTYWDADAGTVTTILENGVKLQHGEELYITVKNGEASPILNGQPVYLDGESGQLPLAYLSDADATEKYRVAGVATEDITTNGKITTFGLVRTIPLTVKPGGETWVAGDDLYLSTTAGQMTNVEPTAPTPNTKVGTIVNVTGTASFDLLIRILNAVGIYSLYDFNGTLPTVDGQTVVWDEVNGYFKAGETAEDSAYDNTDSGLTALTIKTAIDENAGDIGTNVTAIGLNTTHRGITTGNPHSVTQTEVGLGNVDNTSDATKNAAVATLTNKTLTSPKINEDVALTATATELNAHEGRIDSLETLSTANQLLAVENQRAIAETKEAVSKAVVSGDVLSVSDYEIASLSAQAMSTHVASAELKGLTKTNQAVATWATALDGWTSAYDSIVSSKYRLTHTADATGERDISSILTLTKYWLLIVEANSVTDTTGGKFDVIDGTGGASIVASTTVTATQTKRIGLILQPTDLTGTTPYLQMTHKGSGYTNFSDFTIIEITATEYALGLTTLLEKIPRYFSGTQSVKGNGAWRASGINRLSPWMVKTTSLATVTQLGNGVNLTGTYFARIFNTDIGMKSGDTFVMHWDVTTISGSPVNQWRLQYTDNSYSSQVNVDVALTATKDVYAILLYVAAASTASANYTDLYLAKEATYTSFKEYTETIRFFNASQDLRSVPAIEDRVYESQGVTRLEKNVETGALGAELVTNGTFDTDTDWTKDAGWTISGGTLNVNTASTSSAYQGSVITSGKLYKIEYTISSYTSGSFRVRISSLQYGTTRTSAGTFVDYLLANANGSLDLLSLSAFIGSIDNVSAKEIATTAGTPKAIASQTQVSDDGTNGYYQLATPVTTVIEATGSLNSNPSGTVIRLPWTADVQKYSSGFTATGILELIAIWKIDTTTGVPTQYSVANASLSTDSFTDTDFSDDDWGYFIYRTEDEHPEGYLTVGSYNDTHLLIDSVTGTIYRLTFSVASGVISMNLEDIG